MNKSLLAIAVASLLPHASFSYAQEATADETLVVTASRFEQPLSEVIASTTVITRQEIQSTQAKSLTDVLKRVPGVEVTQAGGRGQSASIFLRGFNSDQTLLLIDGVRIESAAGGIKFNHIPIGLVERVEVIKGPGAALYGSDAIAGVINVITLADSKVESTTVSLGGGSDSFKEGNFSTVKRFDNQGQLTIAAGLEETEGYDIKNPSTGLNYGYESQNIYLAYSQPFAEHFSGSATVRWFDSLSEYDSFGKKYSYSENLSLTGEVAYKRTDFDSILRVNQQSIDNLDYSSAEGKDNASTKKQIELTNVQFLNLYQLNDSVSLGGGADWRREKLKDGALSYGSPDALAGEARDTTGVYASANANINAFKFTGSVRNDKHDEYDNYTTWSLGGAYTVNEQHQVRVNVGTSFKAPSYSDLTYNKDLKPEEATSREIGYVGNFDLLDLEITVYDNDVDNLIIWYEGSPWYPLNVDAELRGVEIVTTFDTWFIQHTVIAEFKDHQDSKGNKLAKRADENYKWLLDASYENFDFNLTYTYTGERLGNPNEAPKSDNMLPSVSLWDVSAGYWVTSDVIVSARVDNLLDEEYETTMGYKAPERRVFANLTYEF